MCSDYYPSDDADIRWQSFHQMGFPATQVFERAGPIVDPMYHNSGRSIYAWSRSITHASICLGDLSDRDGYDFDQIKSIAKIQVRSLQRRKVWHNADRSAQFATILHAAGFDLPSHD